mmetsp:Transcript_9867/g.27604  ORF Transcript_9867/g.27604 Transcript_9867/m.27604 type:complete len:1197 (+) Transcript_9867:1-3591(+)
MPCPTVEFPAQALLGDIDLAIAHADGLLSGNPGPVHLNMCFRENLAPDGGAVRGAPERTSAWDPSYLDTPQMHRWCSGNEPRSVYVRPVLSLGVSSVVDELVEFARRQDSRIILLVGSLRHADEALMVEDMAQRLGAAVFADITSGLRQRPGVVHFADQLLNCPLLAADLLQIDVVLHVGGPLVSARLNAFSKAAEPQLHIRVAHAPIRMDQDYTVTHHIPCSLQALAEALVERGLSRYPGPPAFWKRLSDAAEEVVDALLTQSGAFTEPFVAHTVSRLLHPGGHLQISSSMPIRDLDFFSKPSLDATLTPHPPVANRGAAGIDGVMSTAAGFCHGVGAPTTLVIGDIASIHDINALQQLASAGDLSLTVVIVNNFGGGIFNFLPIAKHTDVLSQYFNEPHAVNFAAACQAFGVAYTLCESARDFEFAYTQSQAPVPPGCRVIEARMRVSHEDNVLVHKKLGQAVAERAKAEILSQIQLGWSHSVGTDANQEAGNETFVLLHGWLGEKADWADVTKLLTESGHDVLSIDLPGHGVAEVGSNRVGDGWEAAALYSLPVMVEALSDVLQRLHIKCPIVAGYSLGGRVAMSLATLHPEQVRGTVALSAHPGLESNIERRQRCIGDAAVARRLTAVSFADFLKAWYAAPLWSGFVERSPDVYASMLAKRLRARPKSASLALLGMSLGRQASCWKLASLHTFWYAYGGLDSKFAGVAAEIERRSQASAGVANGKSTCPRVCSVASAGHAVVEECPREVASFLNQIAASLCGTSPLPRPPPLGSVVQIKAVWSEPLELALKAPLLLSRGDPMPRRSGILIVLQGVLSDVCAAGVGEVCPLPMFHQESLAQAEEQLNLVLKAWSQKPPAVPLELMRLNGAMGRWLAQSCPRGQELLPSVRSGLEMALLHLLGRVSGAPHLGAAAAAEHGLSCASHAGINALVAREEDLNGALGGVTVVKVKVGKDPGEDANRVNTLANALQIQRGPSARLRLDANQAWSVDDAAAFINALSEQSVEMVEYLEEPVQWTAEGAESFLRSWEELAERTSNRIAFAVDESLTETALSTRHLEACEAPVVALVLKPALQGIEQTLKFAAWSLRHGAQPVVSSAFESGVALCHFAILAAVMSAPAQGMRASGVSACHGLGTFTRLAEDVLDPPFADLVDVHGCSGWCVSIFRCQEALDRTADALMASRAPIAKSHAWC